MSFIPSSFSAGCKGMVNLQYLCLRSIIILFEGVLPMFT